MCRVMWVPIGWSGKVRQHLQRGGSVQITSSELTVYHTTSCCFLLCVLLQEKGDRRHFVTEVPVACQNIVLLIHFRGWQNAVILWAPLSTERLSDTFQHDTSVLLPSLVFALPLSAALCVSVVWQKEDVCAASLSSGKKQCIASRRLCILPLWLSSVSMTCNLIQKQYRYTLIHTENSYLAFVLIFTNFSLNSFWICFFFNLSLVWLI